MLTFRNTNIVFILLLVLALAINQFTHLPFFGYLLLLLGYSLVVFYGCYEVSSGFFLPVYCAAINGKKEIALSFDDGPATQYTIETLQVLKEQEVKAAFFCIGHRIKGNEQLLQAVHRQGHLIGNHSYSHHYWFDLFSSKKMLADMQQMDQEVLRVTGMQPKIFRPPYGVINPNLKKAIIRGKYTPVGWSVRSMDTVIKDEQKLYKKIKRALQPGAVFLFHDTSRTTLAVLPGFIKWVRENGYEIVRLDQLLQIKPYA